VPRSDYTGRNRVFIIKKIIFPKIVPKITRNYQKIPEESAERRRAFM
jgi:hypothetical protein